MKITGITKEFGQLSVSLADDIFLENKFDVNDEISIHWDKAKENSLEYFLFERYSLYTGHRGILHRAYTHHQPWKYTLAKVNIEANTLLQSYNLGIEDLHSPEYVHMSSGVQVRTWSINPVEVIS